MGRRTLRAAALVLLAVAGQTGLARSEDVVRGSNGPDVAATAEDGYVLPQTAMPPALEDSMSLGEMATTMADGPGAACGCGRPAWRMAEPCRVWTIDYRARSFFGSHTSYQFGTGPWTDPGWAPLSKLDWSLDSTWHGLQVECAGETARIRFEWLTPMQRNIDGPIADYDWNIDPPQDDPSRLDSLTLSSLRWNEGQMTDLAGEIKLTEWLFNWPIELWPMCGYRWQRFNMTGYNLDYLVPALGPDPDCEGVDVFTFSQQYHVLYIGGQLRAVANCFGVPIALRFQGDWGVTWGYNSDHHLLRDDGTRFTMETTEGGTMHLALGAEAMLSRRLSVGLDLDHVAIRTTGEHRWVVYSRQIDEKWDNGVEVNSDQTWLTAFLRVRF